MRDLESPLAAIKGRWMTGLAGADAAPSAWRAMIGEGREAELRLLALAGQAGEIGWAPTAPELHVAAPLPKLALPPMPEPARVLFRRVLAQDKPSAEELAHVLHLIAARGYSVHPADWMPAASDTTAPPLYGPWIDWRNAGAEGGAEALTADTWDGFMPSERRIALASIRRSDPDAMRALLAEKAGGAPAEERLRLVALLGEGLNEADIPYLESLEGDRSGKVKALAGQYLARLGARRSGAEAVAELADMLEMARIRMLGLAKGLGPKTLKNDAQRKRRIELFAMVSLHDIAAAFDLAPEKAVEGWRLGADGSVTEAFAMMVASTGPDAVQRPLAERLMAEGRPDTAAHLTPRLDPAARAALAGEALRIKDDRFRLARDLFAPDLGAVALASLTDAPDFRTLEAALSEMAALARKQVAALRSGQDAVAEKTSWQAEAKITDSMRMLGLLADRRAAASLIDRFKTTGLIPADPRLAMLYLNAALTKAAP